MNLTVFPSTAGSDYVALSQELTFDSGDSDSQCVNITIIDDNVADGQIEFFRVRASSVTLADPTPENIILEDNDRKRKATMSSIFIYPPALLTICVSLGKVHSLSSCGLCYNTIRGLRECEQLVFNKDSIVC